MRSLLQVGLMLTLGVACGLASARPLRAQAPSTGDAPTTSDTEAGTGGTSMAPAQGDSAGASTTPTRRPRRRPRATPPPESTTDAAQESSQEASQETSMNATMATDREPVAPANAGAGAGASAGMDATGSAASSARATSPTGQARPALAGPLSDAGVPQREPPSGAATQPAGANEGSRGPGPDAGVPMPTGLQTAAAQLDAGVPQAPDTSDPNAAALLIDAGTADADAGVVAGAELEHGETEGAEATTASPAATTASGAQAPSAEPEPRTTYIQMPMAMPFAQGNDGSDPWEDVLREVIPGIPTGGIGPYGLLTLLGLIGLLLLAVERLRGRLLRDGLIPSALSILQLLLRLVALLVALGLVIQMIPTNLRGIVVFILMAGGAALGWSLRDVMPDLIAGVVIVFERRIRKGMWVRGERFAGTIERIGLRASWLRDAHGHRVAVPNHHLMQTPLVSDEQGDTVQEVMVRMSRLGHATDVRRALHDAVLASPWTSPNCEPMVMRDPVDASLWQVRGRLLSPTYASAFQGQLLERAEANLAEIERARATKEQAATQESGSDSKPDKAERSDKSDKSDKSGKTQKNQKPQERS